VDSRDSFISVEKWISQVNQRTPSSVKKLLIANKTDVEPDKREVTKEEG
jgi:GTPase SAR1 family protein